MVAHLGGHAVASPPFCSGVGRKGVSAAPFIVPLSSPRIVYTHINVLVSVDTGTSTVHSL